MDENVTLEDDINSMKKMIETYEYYKCVYQDHTIEYWESEVEKDSQCHRDYGCDPNLAKEFEECQSKTFLACKTEK